MLVASTNVSAPLLTTRPATRIELFNGTSTTANPAFFVSTRMLPLSSRSTNQHPATGHFSIILPDNTTSVAEGDCFTTDALTADPWKAGPSVLDFSPPHAVSNSASAIGYTDLIMAQDLFRALPVANIAKRCSHRVSFPSGHRKNRSCAMIRS